MTPHVTEITCRIHREACDMLRRNVFPLLQEDTVVETMRYDELLILFGNRLCRKFEGPQFCDMIAKRLRLLGNLLIKIKRDSAHVDDFFTLFRPENYHATLSAVLLLAGHNGFVLLLGLQLIQQMARLCIDLYKERQDRRKQARAELFLTLLENRGIV